MTLDRSRLIAGILGPVLMAVTATEAIHLDIWSKAPPPLIHLNGMVLFAAGVAAARTHWVWERSWRILVTLTGCALMVGGFLRMALPELPQAAPGIPAYAAIGALFLLGAVLTILSGRKGGDGT